MNDWLHALRQCGERGLDAVLVTVRSGTGSTPRDAGARMVVTVDAIHGTIGGGELEYQAIDVGRTLLRSSGASQTRRFPLGASLGQVCGGAANLAFERVPAGADWVRALAQLETDGTPCVLVTPAAPDAAGRLIVDDRHCWGGLGEAADDAKAAALARELLSRGGEGSEVAALGGEARVILEPVLPVDFEVVLFGAGHVGRALARVLGTLACRVRWVDSRAHEFPPEVAANVRLVVTDAPLDEVGRARTGAYFLVLTHSHALDFGLVEAILKRGDFAYCGMIGSATKRRTLENGLAKHGIPPATLARFTCPIGVPSIKGKEPATIAIAVAAQLLELRERGTAAGRDEGREPCSRAPARRA
jgi:xanthine dehydrogenase accessory factor